MDPITIVIGGVIVAIIFRPTKALITGTTKFGEDVAKQKQKLSK